MAQERSCGYGFENSRLGYLTRRLVDVSPEVRETDCGPKKVCCFDVKDGSEIIESPREDRGRYTVELTVDPNRRVSRSRYDD